MLLTKGENLLQSGHPASGPIEVRLKYMIVTTIDSYVG